LKGSDLTLLLVWFLPYS